jgi:site-specific recombinase XerD
LKEKNTRSSETTIRAYDSDLNIFFCWNVEQNSNKSFVEIKKLEFADFFSYVIEEMKWGSARFGRMRACLSSLSIFIEKFYDSEFPQFRNVILKVIENMPKVAVREKTVLSEEQVDELIEHLKEKDLQQAVWLSLAVSSGSRFSEIMRITVDIIDENSTAFDGLFLETTKFIRTKGRGRNGKPLKKYILKSMFWPIYKEWLEKREIILNEKNQIHNSIFIKKDGSPADAGTVRGWIRGMEEFLGVPYYPHSNRHYFCTMLSKLGIPPQLIQEIIGWDGLEMVSRYDDTEVKDKKWKELDVLRD